MFDEDGEWSSERSSQRKVNHDLQSDKSDVRDSPERQTIHLRKDNRNFHLGDQRGILISSHTGTPFKSETEQKTVYLLILFTLIRTFSLARITLSYTQERSNERCECCET